jgi:hypothetical protein
MSYSGTGLYYITINMSHLQRSCISLTTSPLFIGTELMSLTSQLFVLYSLQAL